MRITINTAEAESRLDELAALVDVVERLDDVPEHIIDLLARLCEGGINHLFVFESITTTPTGDAVVHFGLNGAAESCIAALRALEIMDVVRHP